MQKLVDGVAKFHRTTSPVVQPVLAHLAMHGQSPQAMMITCADSRIMPEELTNADAGDLFMIRNIGNLVPRPEDAAAGTDTSVGAALDYALNVLNVKNIVVMGHSGCGAMKALMDWDSDPGHIGNWLRNGRLALSRMSSNQFENRDLPECDRLSQINVLASLDNLGHYLSVRERLDKFSVTLHGWWLDVANAEVLAYDKRSESFLTLESVYAGGAPLTLR